MLGHLQLVAVALDDDVAGLGPGLRFGSFAWGRAGAIDTGRVRMTGSYS